VEYFWSMAVSISLEAHMFLIISIHGRMLLVTEHAQTAEV
jgi:hypothetical protein